MSSRSRSNAAQLKTLAPPVSDEALLSTKEKLILLRGSKLHGCTFWPWKEAPHHTEFDTSFEDRTEFRFSSEQKNVFDGWQRPRAALSAQVSGVAKRAGTRQVDLVQDVTSDCSVVASLCAETARAERLGAGLESVVSAILFPPVGTSSGGKYVLKLNFNGCFRRVEIDDRLPSAKGSRTLHVFDRSDPDVYWPALVEKAYLKVRGGYDFPGSNSGTDLWVLTGWIPEQLFLQSDDIVPSAFWKRLFNAFQFGDVLVTIGTPRIGPREERALGLASEHAYAIVGMKEEEDGKRLFLVKNPWSEGGVWAGSARDKVRDKEERGKHAREAMMPGTFWMDLNSVLAEFETIYLNWNPGLFRHRKDVHFTWDLTERSSRGSFNDNPQYSLYCEEGGTVWILLSKHFQSFPERDPDNPYSERLQTGFLSLYAFETGHRVMLTDGSMLRSPYVDAPNILLRFEAISKTTYTIVASEQSLPSSNLDFTLSLFSTNICTFNAAKRKHSHCAVQSGAWSYTTAGGNSGSPRYSSNPQFSLTLPLKSDITIVLEAEDPDLAVHVKLIWASGKRIPSKITKKDIFGDSGEYRRGCALAEIPQVLAGTYTIVCSTFKQSQLGRFSLQVWSKAEHCSMKPIPVAEPGMFFMSLPLASFAGGCDRILAPLTVPRLTRLHLRAQSMASSEPASPSPLRVSLEYGQGPDTVELATTNEFIDATGGIRTVDVDLKPAVCNENGPGVWVVVERMGGSCSEFPEQVRVEVLSSEQGVQVGLWGKEADEPIEVLTRNMAASSVSSRS